MEPLVHTVDLRSSPSSPPIAVADDLVLAVRSPRSAESVTVTIGPAVMEFSADVEAPPGIQVRNQIDLASHDETVSGLIHVGDAESKHFTASGREFRITLLEIASELEGDQPFPIYRFLIQEEPRGSSEGRKDQRREILARHDAAIQSDDGETVRLTSDAFSESLRVELSPPLEEHRILGQMQYNEAVTFRAAGDRVNERAVYSRLIQEFDLPDGVLQEWVAKAFFARASSYGQDGDHARAVEDLVEIDRRYGRLTSLGAMTLVAQAVINMAVAFRALGRFEDMREMAGAVVTRYGDHEEQSLTEQVARARSLLDEA